jgi:hypothetical protein
VLDPDGRPQFVHLLIIDVRLAHEIGKGVGYRVQLALDRLVASSLRVLKHGNQYHDHDRHDRRPGSQPGRRETRQDSEREPDHYTGDATKKEGPATHGVRGRRGDLVESRSLPIDLTGRKRPRRSFLEFMVFVHECRLPADVVLGTTAAAVATRSQTARTEADSHESGMADCRTGPDGRDVPDSYARRRTLTAFSLLDGSLLMHPRCRFR